MSPLLVIDVAHPPRHPDIVEEELMGALRNVQASRELRVLKVIHGYGSGGKGGGTKLVVRNWAYLQRKRLRAIIPGEAYDLSGDDAVEMRKEVGIFPDEDFGAANPGITYLWVR